MRKCLVMRAAELSRWSPKRLFLEAAKRHFSNYEKAADFFYHEWLIDDRLELVVANYCHQLLGQGRPTKH